MSTKRERLLDWIRNGDPEQMPVCLGLHTPTVAAAKLGKDMAAVSWAECVDVAEQTGTHMLACIGMPLPFNAIPFVETIDETVVEDVSDDGIPRRTKVITTPEGELREVVEMPSDKGAYHREFLVENEKDLRALASMIRTTCEAIVNNPAVRQSVYESADAIRQQVDGQFPLMLWPFIPAVELMSSFYMDQVTAIYLVADNRELMEELMEHLWMATEVWLEVGRELDIDIYGYAINGYEWLSPDLYHRYMIPQARKLNEMIHAQDKLSWLHTCGKIQRIAEEGLYQQMKVDVLESLSLPPAGDIENLHKTRADIGEEIVTRGSISCDMMYAENTGPLQDRIETVLDSMRGFKHILGDENPSAPAYPWTNIKLVIDTVRRKGRLFE